MYVCIYIYMYAYFLMVTDFMSTLHHLPFIIYITLQVSVRMI